MLYFYCVFVCTARKEDYAMNRPRSFRFAILILIAAFICASPAFAAGKPGPPRSDFDEVWKLVKERFYDKATNGADWDGARELYESKADAAATPEEMSEVINGMLSLLKTSHTRYYTRSEVDFYGLASIFSHGPLREELARFFPGGAVQYTGIGITTTVIDGKAFVKDVLEGGPGDKAGLRRGDELLAADAAPFRQIGSFVGKTGKEVRLIVMYGPNPGDVRQVPVVPDAIIPDKLYYDAMKESARIIEAHGRKIGYIHVWSYAGDRYQDLLEEMVAGKLAGADALVLDLRDGWGGASPEYLDIFNTKVPVITETNREGKKATVDTQWRKPVVMLINEGSRSGKEILAYGFRKYGLGKLVGTKTAGYVMAGRPFILTSGNMLYLAVADVLVDGERLEGVGVEPDVEVRMPLEYTHGKDPQLEKALELLGK